MGTRHTRSSKLYWFNVRLGKAREQGINLNLNKTLAQFCIFHNSTRRTAMEILYIFKMKGSIKIEKGEIIPQ